MGLRELRKEDAAAVSDLIRGANATRFMDAEEIRSWFHNPVLDCANLRVLDRGGRLAGYVDDVLREDVAFLDPSGNGEEDALLEWGESRAAELAATRVRVPVWAGQDRLRTALEAHGYRPVRASFEMVVELDDAPPPAPSWPDGVTVRAYRHPEDERAAHATQEEAFRDAWEYRPTTLDEWREFQVNAPGFDASLSFLAYDGDEVAGICLVFAERPGDADVGWISILGVRRPWRRRGLGEALLRHSFRELHGRGLRRVALAVDAENPTGATRLYERVGMRPTVRIDSWEKVLA
jgi:mycothiol synthase